jgi:transposase
VKYPAELRERAVRMVAESTLEHETQWAAMRSVAQMLGIGSTETVRKWVRDAEARAAGGPGGIGGAAGQRAGEDSAEVKRLKREVAELRRANEILKAAAGFFAAELDRPHRSW